MQNIIDALEDEDIPRLRIGIGEEFKRGRQKDHVLSSFEQRECETINPTLDYARDAALTFIAEGIVPAMNRFNRRPRTSEKQSEEASGRAQSS